MWHRVHGRQKWLEQQQQQQQQPRVCVIFGFFLLYFIISFHMSLANRIETKHVEKMALIPIKPVHSNSIYYCVWRWWWWWWAAPQWTKQTHTKRTHIPICWNWMHAQSEVNDEVYLYLQRRWCKRLQFDRNAYRIIYLILNMLNWDNWSMAAFRYIDTVHEHSTLSLMLVFTVWQLIRRRFAFVNWRIAPIHI